MQRKIIGLICLLLTTLTAWADTAAVLVYLEKEPRQDPYLSKVTISDGYMRIDSGRDGGFVLFDRKKKEVYSVSGFDKTIMVISKRVALSKSPIEISFKTEPVEIEEQIFNRKMFHHRLFANAQRCADIFSVEMDKGIIPILKEFYNILAREHAQVLQSTPKDVLDPCDLSLHIYHSNARFKYGLPSQEIDYTGKQRILLDFELQRQVPDKWWTLPKDYPQYHPGQIRGIDLDA